MMYHFIPQGVCARNIQLEVEEGILQSLWIEGGCPGNLQALCALAQGLPVQTIIDKLQSIRCGEKSSSCPHQLTVALEQMLRQTQGNS